MRTSCITIPFWPTSAEAASYGPLFENDLKLFQRWAVGSAKIAIFIIASLFILVIHRRRGEVSKFNLSAGALRRLLRPFTKGSAMLHLPSYQNATGIGIRKPSMLHPLFALICLPLFLVSPVESSPIPNQIHTRDVDCTTSTWQDILLFVLVNYVAHVATVINLPGESAMVGGCFKLTALLVPFSGVMRGFRAIALAKSWGESDLQYAARSGALCYVDGYSTNSSDDAVTLGDNIETRWAESVHGRCCLPPGYSLCRLPSNRSIIETVGGRTFLLSSQNIIGSVVAIIQIIYSTLTLYQARGTQLQQFGYAAFALTVIQYAVMSMVNLIGNLVSPTYPSLYIVRSSSYDEAVRRGAQIEGTVGELQNSNTNIEHEPDESDTQGQLQNSDTNVAQEPEKSAIQGPRLHVPLYVDDSPLDPFADVTYNTRKVVGYFLPEGYCSRTWTTWETTWFCLALLIVLSALVAPYAIIGALTQFQAQQSTRSQRSWIMCWLVISQVYGFVFGSNYLMDIPTEDNGSFVEGKHLWLRKVKLCWPIIFMTIVFGVPAIGGLVMVVEVMKEYNKSCTVL